jgi:hypothetical protein
MLSVCGFLLNFIYIKKKLKSNQKPEKSNQIWFEKFKLKKPK